MEDKYKKILKTIAGYIGHELDNDIIAADFKQFLLAFVPKDMRIELYNEMTNGCDSLNCGTGGCPIEPKDLGLKPADVEHN